MSEPISLSAIVGSGYDEFWNTRKFYRICKGAKGSKKSRTTALWYIVNMMKYPDANTLVIRRFYSDILGSCYEELLWAINRLGVNHLWTAKLSPMKLTYTPTGQVILFKGLDDASKLASMTVHQGYLCWFWFEEMYQISSEEEFEKVEMSLRGAIPPETGLFKQITGTFNPWSEHHWLKARFFDNPPDNVFVMTSTYRCNEWLGEEDIRRYEELRVRNPKRARIVCDGEWGVSDGLVYENWEEMDFDYRELISRPNIKTTFGLDFGYAVSYNAFVAVAVDVGTRTLWVWDEMYSKGMTNLDIAKKIIDMGYGKERIIADSAEPKSIYELQSGFLEEFENEEGERDFIRYSLPNIRSAMKGPDSVKNGIQRLQSFKMYIHPRCQNMLIELSNYSYAKNKDGQFTDKPEKEFDHLCDALRMSMEKFFIHSRGHVAEAKGNDMAIHHGQRSRRVVSTL